MHLQVLRMLKVQAEPLLFVKYYDAIQILKQKQQHKNTNLPIVRYNAEDSIKRAIHPKF